MTSETHADGSEEQSIENDALRGFEFVFSGAFHYEPIYKSLTADRGGDVASSVSDDTDYLVLGENPEQQLRDQARRHDVPIVDEVEFQALYTAFVEER